MIKVESIKFLPSSVEAMITRDVISHVEPILGDTGTSIDKEEEDHIIRQLERADQIREIPEDYYSGY
jgi:hypothetical protein